MLGKRLARRKIKCVWGGGGSVKRDKQTEKEREREKPRRQASKTEFRRAQFTESLSAVFHFGYRNISVGYIEELVSQQNKGTLIYASMVFHHGTY